MTHEEQKALDEDDEKLWRSSGWKHDPTYLYEIRDKLWKVNSDSAIDLEAIDDLLTIFENES